MTGRRIVKKLYPSLSVDDLQAYGEHPSLTIGIVLYDPYFLDFEHGSAKLPITLFCVFKNGDRDSSITRPASRLPFLVKACWPLL